MNTVVQVAHALVRIAQTTPDFVYEGHRIGGLTKVARYFHEGRPDCLLARALFKVIDHTAERFATEGTPIETVIEHLLSRGVLLLGTTDEDAGRELVEALTEAQHRQDEHKPWGYAARDVAEWIAKWDWPQAKTIDGITVTKGLVAWNYDMKPCRIAGVSGYNNVLTPWFATTSGGMFDGGRLWVRNPMDGRPAEMPEEARA